jgi:predicted N-acetyltransferase YhbS
MEEAEARSEMVIREIREDELEVMTEVWEKAGLPYRPVGRDSMESLRYQRKRDPDLFLGAFIERRFVGVVIASDDGRKGWINRLAVLPDFRGAGIGTALVEAGEQALRKRGRGVFSILIEGENPSSERLFLRHGYRSEDHIRYFAKRDSEEI